MAVVEGDPFGDLKPDKKDPYPPPGEVNRLHYRADTDSSTSALHHTLGIGHNQAAYGDHAHNGSNSKKLGTGLGLTLIGSKGGNVALANLITMLKNFIEFTDSTT